MPLKVETRFENLSRGLLADVRRKTASGLEEAGKILLPASKSAVPVDTGGLLRSIDYHVEGQTGQLRAGGPGARHANLVEFGTYKMPPRSFLRAPAERLKRTIRLVMARILKR